MLSVRRRSPSVGSTVRGLIGSCLALTIWAPALAADPSAAPMGSGAPAATPPSVGIRPITIPDTRIVSMSPDGTGIAALRPAVGYPRGELCVFETDTLAERSCADLSGLDSGIRVSDIRWSPDGTHIAFGEEAFRLFKDGDMWLMDTATGALTNLDDDGFQGSLPFGADATPAPRPISIDVSPAFTPDGRSVAFSRSTWGNAARGNDIAIVSLDGGDPVTLVEVDDEAPGVVYFGMAWSPDGETLYYSRGDPDPDSPSNGIWRVDPDGSDHRLLVGRHDDRLGEPGVLSVSADGRTLLAWHPRAAMQGLAEQLMLVDVETGWLTPLETEAEATVVQMAALSPDSSSVLLVTRNTDPDHQVWLQDIDTGQRIPLVPEGLTQAGPTDWSIPPTWSADGDVLITGGAAFSDATLLTIGD